MAYPITKFWFYPLNWVMIKRIKGENNIPENPNFIIISNHEHLIDPLYIVYTMLLKLNKKVHFLSSARWWFLGDTVCRKWAGCVPLFDRKQAYHESKKLIESGEIIGIFPEGGLRRTKNPKTGAVRLAIETKTPILPIGIKSSYIPFNSTMNIGKLIYLKKNKKNLKKQAFDLMKKIYKLSDSKI
ncbi:1-acyl-sn-glycerol-3-phosphate acyltransferase [Candidatus Woesearchaeota archaeon]|nr:1-acyl-sn-glycerol-3-phosphate acyltransferase [Candidatus Woesearchaeota archaeon]